MQTECPRNTNMNGWSQNRFFFKCGTAQSINGTKQAQPVNGANIIQVYIDGVTALVYSSLSVSGVGRATFFLQKFVSYDYVPTAVCNSYCYTSTVLLILIPEIYRK